MRLATLQIPRPCGERWEEMPGDDESRRCARCGHDVVNLSALHEREAETRLADAAGKRLCVSVLRTVNGAVITRTSRQRQLVAVLRAAAAARQDAK